ncbi:MAG: radical SAM protein [bacterium]|nr:radical SAM protein [bacterium]
MGSGTIFFTQCSLRCVFCQNYPISQLGVGNETDEEALSNMMIELQNMGAHNINLVTPTHFVPPIIKSIYIARGKGLNIPIVYNTGGYDSVETMRLLDGIIDIYIYMPDAKYGDSKIASKYSDASNYVNVMKLAVKEMHSQVGDLVVENGIAKRGLLIRHLILPNNLSSTYKVLEFINKELPKNTYISLMAQYFPAHRANEFKKIARELTDKEYEKATKFMAKLGLNRGWLQQIK